MHLSILVGNPKKGSRTLQVAEALADRVERLTGARRKATVDLADHADVLFQWPNDSLAELTDVVRTSELLIVASPTYKATYTGLLKAFLDRYPTDGLAGVTAIPVMTASSPLHALAVEMTLRPLLVELGASVPTRGLAFLMSEIGTIDDALDEWAARNLAVPGILAPYADVEEVEE